MPNHVTNRLTITGTKEQIDAFEKAFIEPKPSDTDPCGWSFEHFQSMPIILRKTVSSGSPTPRVYCSDSPNGSRDATPEEVAEITATGYSDWYSWSTAHWGTKWDAYSKDWERTSDTEAVLLFNTAWSCPEPVFASMADNPIISPLHITITAFDEGWNFAFEGEISEGTYEGNAVTATKELYEAVYGEPYEGEIEEEEMT